MNKNTYSNPILYTDYSDPDAIRVKDDYFMIASSFSNVPGIPILHSKDLIHWQIINYVLDSLPDVRYDNPVHGCGVWAPSIRFHEGIFYVCFPMPDEGIYMCTSTDPFQKWSAPVNIRPGAGWIDPCPFWDDDGKAYLVAGVAKSRIGYKSVLNIVEMRPDGLGLIGPEIKIFDGNENDQVTIEGPKLYKRNGYYYIFAPAGGVKTGWQTVLRAQNKVSVYADAPNLLLQKWPAKEFACITQFDIANLTVGDETGILSLGMEYGVVTVERTVENFELSRVLGKQTFGKILVEHSLMMTGQNIC